MRAAAFVGLAMHALLYCCSCIYPGLCEPYSEAVLAGHKRLRELANHYEVVEVDTAQHLQHVGRQRRSSGDDASFAHPDFTGFEVRAFGKTFQLDLELNKVLLPTGFHVRSYTAGGEVVIDRDVVHCYYQGSVRVLTAGGAGEADPGDHGSHAVVSTCGGISGSFGVGPAGHWTDEETFFIEPLTSVPNDNGTHFHGVFKVGDAKSFDPPRLGSCGVANNTGSDGLSGGKSEFTAGERYSAKQRHDGRHRLRRQAQTDTKFMYVELLLAMDNELYKRLNSKITAMRDRALAVVNFLDSIYRPLSIRIPLVAVQVFSAGNPFVITSDLHMALADFTAYLQKNAVGKVHYDNAQLMMARPFQNPAGLGGVRTMCSLGRQSGVNCDFYTSIRTVTEIMAHEMGHNFGMGHNTASCRCPGSSPQTGCVMAASGQSRQKPTWSDCSRRTLEKFLSSGHSHCLHNVPTQLFGDPVCGNGFLEGDEQCDCGTATQCTTTCCNATTCRLTAGSQCHTGPCCSNCEYQRPGAVCRPAANSCDEPETCSGRTHNCPANLFTQNGRQCGSGPSASYCYNGHCNTSSDQCRRFFGPGATTAPYKGCYDSNTKGSVHTNCGFDANTNTYIRCSPDNALCGRLQCINGDTKVDNGILGYRYTFALSGIPCMFIIPFPPTATYTLVEDGVVCGPNSMCISQVCRNISTLGFTPCPSRGGQECSGNGVCTNLNSCRCNHTFTGTDCSVSGQASAPTSLSPGATAGLVIGLLLLFGGIALAGVISKRKANTGSRVRAWFSDGRGTARVLRTAPSPSPTPQRGARQNGRVHSRAAPALDSQAADSGPSHPPDSSGAVPARSKGHAAPARPPPPGSGKQLRSLPAASNTLPSSSRPPLPGSNKPAPPRPSNRPAPGSGDKQVR